MNTVALIIETDESALDLLMKLLASEGVEAQSSPRRNLDGASVTSWLILAGIAVRQVPVVLQALSAFLTRNRVRRLEVNGILIENPSPEDVNRILRQLSAAGGHGNAGDPPVSS